MVSQQPLVSIITINYNESAVTLELLSSLRNIRYKNIEIIVVDNASPNDNSDVIKNEYPEINLIKSDINLGFAGGNNLGVKIAKGDYLLFINNDTIVPKDFIAPLVETLENDKSIGMVSPKIKFHWDDRLIQYAGYTPMNHWTIRNNSIGYKQVDNGDFDVEGETASIHGAAMMVPKRVIEKVGMMTEIYFLYYEEHDWAAQIKKAGYKLYYQPKTYILHKESLSTGKFSPLKTYYIARNRIVYARRNFNKVQLLIALLYLSFISIPKNTITFLLKNQKSHLRSFWKAIRWNLTNFKIIHQ